ncbi:MAG: UDP-N-acetylmuramoyl-tripeptide--D-alanyl-D-alanine ligase [Leptospirillia bacterium]
MSPTVPAFQILESVGGHWYSSPPKSELWWINAGTDSRTISPGSVFVALRGLRTDGHDHLAQALERGASLAVVERGNPDVNIPQIIVEDTLIALRKMGALVLAAHRKAGHRLISLTGSVGKTTTRELIRAGLPPGESHCSSGNENNEIGVPLTLLSWPQTARWCVLEVGIRKPGDMDILTPLLSADTGIVTAIAPVHLETLGTLEGVWKEKSKLLAAVVEGGCRIVPEEIRRRETKDPLFLDPARRLLGVSLDQFPEADISGELEMLEGKAVLSLRRPPLRLPLPWPSRALGWCALMALAALGSEGVDLALAAERISLYRGYSGRMERRRHASGLLLLLDHYNANPVSMSEALEWLSRERGLRRGARAYAVLGDMLELGAESHTFHREIGERAAMSGVEGVWYRGDQKPAFVEGFLRGGGKEFQIHDSSVFESDLQAGRGPGPEDVLLVKGSRGMKLEEVVAKLLEGT